MRLISAIKAESSVGLEISEETGSEVEVAHFELEAAAGIGMQSIVETVVKSGMAVVFVTEESET